MGNEKVGLRHFFPALSFVTDQWERLNGQAGYRGRGRQRRNPGVPRYRSSGPCRHVDHLDSLSSEKT